MTAKDIIAQNPAFGERRIRTAWDADKEEWFFSIVDVVAVLTDQPDTDHARNYWKVLKNRLKKEGNESVTNCNQLKLEAADGKKYKTDVGTPEQILRLIQSIPSPKAEPFKQWMATVAARRIEQLQDPEKSIDQAMADYKRLGYSDAWITQRIQSIEVRKNLTDEWKRSGVEGDQYATLTDIITRQWSGLTTREYKDYKGLKKESLRDNMTNIEIALNILAEATTTELSKQENPEGFRQSAGVAMRGGKAALGARQSIEKTLGRSVVSSANAKQLKGSAPKQIEEKNENE